MEHMTTMKLFTKCVSKSEHSQYDILVTYDFHSACNMSNIISQHMYSLDAELSKDILGFQKYVRHSQLYTYTHVCHIYIYIYGIPPRGFT